VTKKLEGERVIPRWFPNQLRHNFATRMRKEFGLEVTRVLLGHTSVATSEIYAERDSQLAASIVAKIG
jgi:site-specific recombinase XerC